jgi:sugar lactone lactonase YvrE
LKNYGEVTTFAGTGDRGSMDGLLTEATFSNPAGITIDRKGIIHVFSNGGVRKIATNGSVTTIASSVSGNAKGIAADLAGNVYVTDENIGKILKVAANGQVSDFVYDNSSIKIGHPTGIAFGKNGYLYVTDMDGYNVKKISPSGTISIVSGNGEAKSVDGIGRAASFYFPISITIDSSENVYVGEVGSKIRKISPDGVVSTLAGSGTAGFSNGNGTAATFNTSWGVAADFLGNIYVADSGNNQVRKITPVGEVTTLAGSTSYGFLNDIGTKARLSNPFGVVIDAQGNLYVSDTNNSRIRKVNLTGYGITPALPNGLIFDGTTGKISGTPTTKIPVTDYTITAYNLAGQSSAIIKLAVADPVPTITSFYPTSGPIGTSVTINGTNFDPNPDKNIVFFGAVKATVSTASANTLQVIVPLGASFQPITVTINNLIAYSNNPFNVTFSGSAISSSFSSKIDLATGNGVSTKSMSTADFDGDGKPDLAVANDENQSLPNGVSVFKNNGTIGNISFLTKADYSTGSFSEFVTTGDIDGDGKPDMVVANYNSSSISLFRNTSTNGSISFAPKVDLITGSKSYRIAIGDLNADGKADLAVTCWTCNVVSIFTNKSAVGEISFGAPTDYITGLYQSGAIISDLDGDTKPDLIIGNYTSSIFIFKNNSSTGIISFAPKVNYATGGNGPSDVATTAIAIGDLNMDSKPDLAIANFTMNENSVSVFINTSDKGTISLDPRKEFPVGPYVLDIAITDLDGDAKPDIALSHGGFGTPNISGVSIIKNETANGSLSFSPDVLFANGTSSFTTVLNDFDGDGKADIAFANNKYFTISVLRDQLIESSKVPTITSFSPTSAASNQSVTISGTNFTDSTSVNFGGVPAKSVTFVSPTSITATTGLGASGEVSVKTLGGIASLAGFNFISPPTITSITPSSAAAGDTILIKGTGFTEPSKVNFIGSAATSFVVLSSNSMTVVVPADASTGDVVVATPGGTAFFKDFQFIPSPTITSILPTLAASGEVVTITGSNFTGATSVIFGGTAAKSFTVLSSTSISAVVGNGATGDISVKTTGGTASLAGFKFIPSPIITSFSPTSAATGETITVTGSNFSGATSVLLGGTTAQSFAVLSPTSISAIVGNGATGDLSVKATGGTASLAGFKFVPAPIITSFSPTSAANEETITITGSNFSGATSVLLGGVAAKSFTVLSPTSISATVGVGATGDVSVKTPGGTANLAGFKFIPAPTITSFNPTSAAANETITVTGDNLIGTTSVLLGGIPTKSFTILSPTSISAIVGLGATGDVSVKTPAGMANLAGFKFIPAPTITSFNPTSAAANEAITITGSYFIGTTSVLFGGIPAKSFTVLSSTSISAIAGAGATGDISVKTPAGTANLAGFKFIPAPMITSFSPTSTATGETIIITGTNFTAATSVNFGGIPSKSFTVLSPTSISAIVGTGGTGDISVKTPGGTANLTGFTFIPPPKITSFSGCSYEMINLNGINFTDASAVAFGGIPAKSFKVISQTVIEAVAVAGSSGKIEVKTPGGTSGINGFVYLPKPIITASGPTVFSKGGKVVLKTLSVSGIEYAWMRDGKMLVAGAFDSLFTAIETGVYTVALKSSGDCIRTSDPVTVKAVYTLPSNNFKISATGESCKTSNNGSINLSAVETLNYTATVTGKSSPYTFTNALAITDLSAGTYSICITITDQPDYKQCFEVAITEPKDLSVYSTVDPSTNNILLQLEGGAIYTVDLNGKKFSTTKSSHTLPLAPGENILKVTSDKICQGVVEKSIRISEAVIVYPNPFEDILTVNLFDKSATSSIIEIRNLDGKIVHAKNYPTQSGTAELNLSELPTGLFILKVSTATSESIFKILKK